jgi:predicted nucleotidyltransferase
MAADPAFSRESGRLRESGNRAKGARLLFLAALRVCIKPMKPSAALELYREEIRRIVESHKGLNPRVFGSALRGDDTEDSDLDLLIDPGEGLTLFGIARIADAVEEITKVRVHVLTPGALSESFRAKVMAEARPI